MIVMRNQDKEIIEIANSQVENLLERLNMTVSKAGRWLSSTCPVHKGDNRTGFGFNVDKGNWRCFTQGCEQKWGNSIIGLVAGILEYSYDDAMEWIVNNIDENGEKIVKSERKIDRIYQESCLKRLFRTDFYLKRGFCQETLDSFEHGRAESGKMLNRVVFPIRDENGFIRGFSGRWAGKEQEIDGKLVCIGSTGKEVPKWKHTSFAKSDYLYHFHNAKPFCKDSLILVESIGNVMRFWDAGYKNCVACMGSSVSWKQSNLIIASTRKVVLAFDNDKAGQKATKNAKKTFEQYLNVTIITPPEGKDWAECSNPETITICQQSM